MSFKEWFKEYSNENRDADVCHCENAYNAGQASKSHEIVFPTLRQALDACPDNMDRVEKWLKGDTQLPASMRSGLTKDQLHMMAMQKNFGRLEGFDWTLKEIARLNGLNKK